MYLLHLIVTLFHYTFQFCLKIIEEFIRFFLIVFYSNAVFSKKIKMIKNCKLVIVLKNYSSVSLGRRA